MDQYKTKRADDDREFDSLSLSYHHHYHCHVIRWNMRYDIFRINDYVVTLSESECQTVQLAICNCTGWQILRKCKHIHFALITKEKGIDTHIDPQTTKQ